MGCRSKYKRETKILEENVVSSYDLEFGKDFINR